MIASRDVQKVYITDDHTATGIAGTAGLAIELVRLFQVELEHYEKIADAPGAVAQLRHFILNLAVRGKLVPQDAEDEPASKLLDRIRNEIPSPKVRSGEVEVSVVG